MKHEGGLPQGFQFTWYSLESPLGCFFYWVYIEKAFRVCFFRKLLEMEYEKES